MHEYAWNMRGLYLEYTWTTHRYARNKCDHAWNMLGICMGYAWNMHGIKELAIREVRVQGDHKHVVLDGTLRRC